MLSVVKSVVYSVASTHIICIAGYGGQFGAGMALVIIVAGAELRLLAGDGHAGKVNGNGGY